MQVRAASGQFARRVNQHPIRRADDAHQLAFRHDGAASHTGPLGNMLHALNRSSWTPSYKPHLHALAREILATSYKRLLMRASIIHPR